MAPSKRFVLFRLEDKSPKKKPVNIKGGLSRVKPREEGIQFVD
jgi:hypothetical protein